MRERIQKFLAAQGVGSRRQLESWIAAGRVSVNGQPARAGQPVDERDDIRLDGRRLRLRAPDEAVDEALIYHRPAGEELKAGAGSEGRSTLERLPRAAGRRWIAVSPLAAGDSGLELFVSDGRLAAALMRSSHELSTEYSLRLRGELDEERVAALQAAVADDAEARGELLALEAAGGEGANRWWAATCRGLRPRDLKRVFEAAGLEVNRVLRTRIGPIAMDRALARGRHRRLTPGESRALADAAGLAGSGPAPRPARKSPRRGGARKGAARDAGRSKPVRRR